MKLLCRSFDDLQQMIVNEPSPDDQDGTGASSASIAGNLPFDRLLLEIDEDYIKYLCRDRLTWLRGLDYYMQGRVTARSVHWNILRASIKGRSKPYYNTEVVLEDINKGGFRASIGCNCMAFRDNKRCKHIAALLVAWVRKPGSFEVCEECSSTFDSDMPDIKGQTDKILELVGDIAQAIEKSSWREDFEMLQNLHTMARNLARFNNLVSPRHYMELSQMSGMAFTAILSFIDMKYGNDMMAFYNNTMSDLMAKMIERFVDSNRKRDARTRHDAENLFNTEHGAGMKVTGQIMTDQPSRSWDGIIDEFKKQTS